MHGVPFSYFYISMSLKICTWNSQGNPYNDKTKKKLDILQQLYKCNDVLLIQECGGIANNLKTDGRCFWNVEQAGAGNNRCSLCIISNVGGFGEVLDATSSTGRSVIHVNIGNIHIYTLHATSGNGLPDVMTLLENAQEPFIIGGDLNCNRSEILNSHGVCGSEVNYAFSGTRSRPNKLGELITSDRLTHPGSGNELDFFIVSLSLRTYSTRLHPVMGGDHYPVCTVVSEYGEYATIRRKNSVLELLNGKTW